MLTQQEVNQSSSMRILSIAQLFHWLIVELYKSLISIHPLRHWYTLLSYLSCEILWSAIFFHQISIWNNRWNGDSQHFLNSSISFHLDHSLELENSWIEVCWSICICFLPCWSDQYKRVATFPNEFAINYAIENSHWAHCPCADMLPIPFEVCRNAARSSTNSILSRKQSDQYLKESALMKCLYLKVSCRLRFYQRVTRISNEWFEGSIPNFIFLKRTIT